MLTLDGSTRAFGDDADAYAQANRVQLATDLVLFAVSSSQDISVTIDSISRGETGTRTTRIEYTLSQTPNTLDAAISNIDDKIVNAHTYQHVPGQSAEWLMISNAAQTAAESVMDLTLDGTLRNFEQDADEYTNGDVDALALDVMTFALSPTTSVAIEILSVSRGAPNSRRCVIECRLTAMAAALMDSAMGNIEDKVDAAESYQFVEGATMWQLLGSEKVSAAMTNAEGGDQNSLDTLDDKAADFDLVRWVPWVAVALGSVVLLSAMVWLTCRRLRSAQSTKPAIMPIENSEGDTPHSVEAQIEMDSMSTRA